MKILKIFGIVVGIHVFALILIFANPGCSSTTKPAPQPADTAVRAAPISPTTSAPPPTIYSSTSDRTPVSPGLGGFNPDAPAINSAGAGMRSSPTRPNSPLAAPLTSEPVADVTPATIYTVKSGDSLSAIAKSRGTTVAQLTAANQLTTNAVLRPGQKLIIPGKAPAGSALAPAPGGGIAAKAAPAASAVNGTRSAEGVRHTVKPGETLGTIAKHYDVRQGEIAVANNISDPAKIKAGTELIIPGWTPAGKSGKSKSGASSATNASESRPTPVGEPASAPAPEQLPTNPPPVPVIRLDDAPITPAPKL